jgi:hypothetical protein
MLVNLLHLFPDPLHPCDDLVHHHIHLQVLLLPLLYLLALLLIQHRQVPVRPIFVNDLII